MTNLDKHKRDWNELGQLDPCWAILIDPARRFGRWNVDEFFLTGQQEIDKIMSRARELGHPVRSQTALDFGCGVGRLTRALAGYFQKCTGADISASMIAKGEELNQSVGNCKFVLNTADHLRIFSDDTFDMIYTGRVLQHMPSKSLMLSYMAEFIRTLRKDGLLVFQCPTNIPWRHRFQPRRRLYHLLRGLGLREAFLYRTLRLIPMRMRSIPKDEVVQFLTKSRARLLSVEPDLYCGPTIPSNTYFVTK